MTTAFQKLICEINLKRGIEISFYTFINNIVIDLIELHDKFKNYVKNTDKSKEWLQKFISENE